MIILNVTKSNTNFKKIAEIYSKILNFNDLECPHCHSHEIELWSFYERNVIYFENEDIKIEKMKIRRCRCKSCKKTHALLPNGIIPYKQITMELIIAILINIINFSFEKTASKFSIPINMVKKYWSQFTKYHFPLLATFTKTKIYLKSILIFRDSLQKQLDYIINNNCCFMQIKLGCIGVKPLWEGATT